MSAPKIVVQILVTGAQIFGKALFEAGKQAARNAKHSPQGATGFDVTGVRNATSGSLTDKLTREHRMTLDEAHLILNTKCGENLENVLKNYKHLFKVNASLPAPSPPVSSSRGGKQLAPPGHSHYIQSKVVRAKERIEAELRVMADSTSPPAGATAPLGSAGGRAEGSS